MPWTEIIAGATALIGVAVGGLITRWNTSTDRNARSASEAAAAERKIEQEAILELLAAARLLTHRANGFRMTVKLIQSEGAKHQRRWGHMVPLDVDAAFDRLVDADQALARASGKVWLNGDPKTVQLTNALALAAADVFDAHSDDPLRGVRKMGRSLQLRYTTKLPGEDSRINEAVWSLGKASRALAEYARQKYGLEYVDLTDSGEPIEQVTE
ncbi:hypothetical protein UB45_05825 [Terrabacter sp. 28]|nr:hypothetical protein UB45_05825 [Terrabacter sp. 28]